ncbi:MAG TPA: hypothetical protein VEA61_07815 [Allosphingosinicella sp.]|nr:hypothetical protein [Allosphingosinicella sp.]
MRILFPLFAFALTPAAAAAQPPATAAAEAPIVAEARAFMASYAEDLWMGNRTAIAARYDPRGAWHVGPARVELESWDQISRRYRTRWAPPSSFQWRDLAFEALGPDTVLVVGGFQWWPQKKADRPPLEYSYTAVLVRRNGELKIRLENEATAAPRDRR